MAPLPRDPMKQRGLGRPNPGPTCFFNASAQRVFFVFAGNAKTNGPNPIPVRANFPAKTILNRPREALLSNLENKAFGRDVPPPGGETLLPTRGNPAPGAGPRAGGGKSRPKKGHPARYTGDPGHTQGPHKAKLSPRGARCPAPASKAMPQPRAAWHEALEASGSRRLAASSDKSRILQTVSGST